MIAPSRSAACCFFCLQHFLSFFLSSFFGFEETRDWRARAWTRACAGEKGSGMTRGKREKQPLVPGGGGNKLKRRASDNKSWEMMTLRERVVRTMLFGLVCLAIFICVVLKELGPDLQYVWEEMKKW